MEKLRKVAQIDAINEFEKNRAMEVFENTNYIIVDDPDYPTIFYIAVRMPY